MKANCVTVAEYVRVGTQTRLITASQLFDWVMCGAELARDQPAGINEVSWSLEEVALSVQHAPAIACLRVCVCRGGRIEIKLVGRWLLATLRDDYVGLGEDLSWCANKAMEIACATELDDGIYEKVELLTEHISLAEYKLEGDLAECRKHLLKVLGKYPLPPIKFAAPAQAFSRNCLREAGLGPL